MTVRATVMELTDVPVVRCWCATESLSVWLACVFVDVGTGSRLGCALKILSKAAAAYKEGEGKGKPAVLVIDDANLMKKDTNAKASLIEKVQLFAKQEADARNLIVVFVSSTGYFSEYLRGSLLCCAVLLTAVRLYTAVCLAGVCLVSLCFMLSCSTKRCFSHEDCHVAGAAH